MPNAKRVKLTLITTLLPIVVLGVTAQPAMGQGRVPSPITTYEGDPGRLGDPASWRTPEFNRDAGLVSMGAEFAYAAGDSGTGMNIGVVDSGFFAGHVREHGSLDTNYTVGDLPHSPVPPTPRALSCTSAGTRPSASRAALPSRSPATRTPRASGWRGSWC